MRNPLRVMRYALCVGGGASNVVRRAFVLSLFFTLHSSIFNLQSALHAQSYFAMRGLGEEVVTSDAAAGALGGLYALSLRNPAWPLHTERTELTASLQLSGNYFSAGGAQRFQAGGRPQFLRARVPLPAGFRLGLGLAEWYSQDFDAWSESLPEYRRHITGQGGIFDLDASVSKDFFGIAGLGVEFAHLLGRTNEQWRFDVYNGGYVTYDSILYTYRGNVIRAGLSGGTSVVTAAGYYEQPLDFSVMTRVRTHATTAESTWHNLSIPPRWGLGLTVAPNPELNLNAEASIRLKAIQADSTNILTPIPCKSSYRVSLGAQYNIAERYPVRFGLRYEDWYLKAAGDEPITAIAVTAGSAVPIAKIGSFDYSLEYANQGTKTFKENILKAQLTLHFEEAWKKRTRNWGY